MAQLLSDNPARHGYTDISIDDFTQQMKAYGWPFWRGFLVGFASASVLGGIAVFEYAALAIS